MTSPDIPRKPKPKAVAKPKAPTHDLVTFARQVLHGLGVPVTTGNVNFIVAWANREGGGGAWNPLNTTQGEPGSTALAGNSAGVQNFTSFAQGVNATVSTLKNGFYNDVVTALQTGKANPNASYSGLSTWSGGGYSNLSGVAATNKAVASGGTFTGGAATNNTDAVTAYANSNFGFLSGFINDPVIGPILKQAAANNWDNSQLLGAIHKNPKANAWWNHTSDTARTFDAEAVLDPAAHRQKVGAQAAQISALAKADGITLDPNRVQQMASTSLRLGWNDQQVRNALSAEYHYNPQGANAVAQKVKSIMNSYLVPQSDASIQSWARQLMSASDPTAAENNLIAYAKEQAKSMFPALSGYLDSSPDANVQTYIEPYKQVAAQTLGLDPASIDFTQPKWNSLINQVDPKTGQRTALTLADAQVKIRTDPTFGYGTSLQGKSDAADLGHALSSAFGF